MKSNYLSETRQTLWLALPFVINQILQMSMETVDSLMAGADGELTLAAIAQGTTLSHLILLGVIGLMMPMTAMIARAYARADHAQLRELFQQSVWLALPLGLLGFAVMWWIPLVLSWVGVDADIIPPASDYLRVVAFGTPFVALFLPVRFFTEGIGKPAAMMLLTATAIPINIVGNYIFLNGLFGLPKMGATGIGISTLLSEMYLCFAGWWFILRYKNMRPLALMVGLTKPLAAPMLRFIHLGVPSALAVLMEAGIFTVVVLLSGRLGVEVAAANQIALNYASNTFMIPWGVSMALATRIGMAMGEGSLGKARIIGISGMVIGAGFMLLSVLTIVIFGRDIATFYTDEAAVIVIAGSLLTLAGVFQVFDGVQVCATGALRGLEETKAPMYYAALGYWVLAAPLAVLLAFPMGMGAEGLWYGLVVGLSTTAILSSRKFLQMTSAAW